MRNRFPSTILGLAILCASAGVGCRRSPVEIIVFHAASLTRAFGDASVAYEKAHPGVHVRLEPSGSQVAARKVAEQGMAADLVVVADAKVIERILVPRHAKYDLIFATNELVIAHKDHSAFTAEISTENWPEILRRPGVRLGRADPDTAPIGYHTLLAWQLAERSGSYGDSGKDLSAELTSRCQKQNIVHDEAELLGQLESKALDYAFLYRSTAEDHHLKTTSLPLDQNLSRPELAARYAQAEMDVQMKQGEAKVHVQGSPITYGLTITDKAPHATEAAQFVAFLLGREGGRILENRGFRPTRPARCAPCDGVPHEIDALIGR